jgi:nicotinamide mononucleotide transporter
MISKYSDYSIAAILSILYFLFAYWGPIPTSHAEVFGFVTGALAVWFVARNRMITWPIGIINAAFFVYLFYEYKLYADMTINIWYMIAGAWGWWMWAKGGEGRTERAISLVPKRELMYVGAAWILATYLVYHLLVYYGGAAPWLDSITASASMAAFYLQGRRYIEAWYIWIAADIIYIPLYYTRELYMTAILYAVFMAMCFVGLKHWKRVYREHGGYEPSKEEKEYV